MNNSIVDYFNHVLSIFNTLHDNVSDESRGGNIKKEDAKNIYRGLSSQFKLENFSEYYESTAVSSEGVKMRYEVLLSNLHILRENILNDMPTIFENNRNLAGRVFGEFLSAEEFMALHL